MGIKNLSLIVLLISSFLGFGQGTETQRKYGFENGTNFNDFIQKSGEIDGFSTNNHSDLSYFDLYFDTPDFDLAEKGYSLRMRKREDGEGGFAYVFQLKSEMETADGVRMEVEETELDFYLLFHNSIKTNLATFLDSIFNKMELVKDNANSESYQPYLTELVNWIDFKAGAPLIPFQKLHFLMPELFTVEGIRKLCPVLIGQSFRSRSHVYLTAENSIKKTGSQLENQVIESETPEFFKNNPTACWLFESSLDESVFYPLFSSDLKSINIKEFEVENKYPDAEKSAVLMSELETSLKGEFGLYNTLNSKYLQSISAFRSKK